MTRRRTAPLLACLLVALASGCARGLIHITILEGPGVDMESITQFHAIVRGQDPGNNEEVEAWLTPGHVYPDHETALYRTGVKEGTWAITMCGYQGDQLVALGETWATISSPVNVASSVDVEVTIVLSADATK